MIERPVEAEAAFAGGDGQQVAGCLEIGERPDLEGAVIGRGSFLAAANLAVLYDGTGRADAARHYRAQAATPASAAPQEIPA